jgi:hypothetical protein
MLPQLLKRSLYGRRINLCLLFLLGFLDAVKIAPQSIRRLVGRHLHLGQIGSARRRDWRNLLKLLLGMSDANVDQLYKFAAKRIAYQRSSLLDQSVKETPLSPAPQVRLRMSFAAEMHAKPSLRVTASIWRLPTRYREPAPVPLRCTPVSVATPPHLESQAATAVSRF